MLKDNRVVEHVLRDLGPAMVQLEVGQGHHIGDGHDCDAHLYLQRRSLSGSGLPRQLEAHRRCYQSFQASLRKAFW